MELEDAVEVNGVWSYVLDRAQRLVSAGLAVVPAGAGAGVRRGASGLI
eukprot:SAG11_NODE_30861_length_296_cov_23.563452_1_plen_47_part_01